MLSAVLHDEMVGHAILCLPEEACGLFAGDSETGRVLEFHPMTNAARSSTLYQLDGREMLDVERRVDEAGLSVLGVMHSHTHTVNYPSPTDVADAQRFDPFGAWHFVIVSLQHAEPSLRSFRINGDEVTEETVVVDPAL